MNLAYQAYNKSGQTVTGVIDASDPAQATELLRKQGLFVASIASAQGARDKPQHAPRARMGRTKQLKNLTLFWRQLHVLMSTGTPLAQALAAMQRQTRNPDWRAVLGDVHQRVLQGSSLSSALETHPGYFDQVHCSLIAAGEISSSLDKILERLAMITQKQYHVRTSLTGAMVYPALLLTIASAVLIVLMIVVLPRFAELFLTLDVPLPPTTVLLMTLSDLLRGYWWTAPIVFVPAFILIKKYLATRKGKYLLDTVLIRAPQFGRVTRSFATAHVVRMLGVLLEGRVPLIQALRLCSQGAGNVHYGQLFVKAEQAVTRGDPISSAFNDDSLITPAVYEAMRNGEQSGQVGPLLMNIANILDDDNDVTLRSLTSLVEPLIMIILGAMVGFVAVSLFMPLFDLTSLIGGEQ
jgi:type II secretory pathway component PulF